MDAKDFVTNQVSLVELVIQNTPYVAVVNTTIPYHTDG